MTNVRRTCILNKKRKNNRILPLTIALPILLLKQARKSSGFVLNTLNVWGAYRQWSQQNETSQTVIQLSKVYFFILFWFRFDIVFIAILNTELVSHSPALIISISEHKSDTLTASKTQVDSFKTTFFLPLCADIFSNLFLSLFFFLFSNKSFIFDSYHDRLQDFLALSVDASFNFHPNPVFHFDVCYWS